MACSIQFLLHINSSVMTRRRFSGIRYWRFFVLSKSAFRTDCSAFTLCAIARARIDQSCELFRKQKSQFKVYDQLTNLIVLKTYYKNKRIDRTAYSVTALFKVTCPVYPVRSSVYRPVRYRQIV